MKLRKSIMLSVFAISLTSFCFAQVFSVERIKIEGGDKQESQNQIVLTIKDSKTTSTYNISKAASLRKYQDGLATQVFASSVDPKKIFLVGSSSFKVSGKDQYYRKGLLVTFDLTSKSVHKSYLKHSLLAERESIINDDRKLIVSRPSDRWPSYGAVVWDLEKKNSYKIPGGFSTAFNLSGEHYAALYGANGFYYIIRGANIRNIQNFKRAKWGVSVLVNYNGEWVYPWVAEKKWHNSDLGIIDLQKFTDGRLEMHFENGEKGDIHATGIKVDGVVYDIATPAFVSDTPWLAFVERVHTESGGETNLVLLDASAYSIEKENAEAIQVRKTPIPDLGDLQLSGDLICKWNDEGSRLEIWKKKIRYRLNPQSLYLWAPIDPKTIEVGELQMADPEP